MNQPNHSREYRPLLGGIAIHNPKNGVEGTLGLIATNGVDHWIVSAYHVLGRGPSTTTLVADGEPIWQPLDASGSAPPMAKLDLPRCDSIRDIAFAKVLPGIACSAWILGVGPVRQEMSPTVGQRLLKSGLSTGVTEGVVVHVDVHVVRIELSPGFPAKYDLSSSADSGSVWVDARTHQAVALHYRGQEGAKEAAYATPIAAALSKAGLTTYV